jgi:hypothetical protein
MPLSANKGATSGKNMRQDETNSLLRVCHDFLLCEVGNKKLALLSDAQRIELRAANSITRARAFE